MLQYYYCATTGNPFSKPEGVAHAVAVPPFGTRTPSRTWTRSVRPFWGFASPFSAQHGSGHFAVDAHKWSSNELSAISTSRASFPSFNRDLDVDDDDVGGAPAWTPVRSGAVAPVGGGASTSKKRKSVHQYELLEVLGRGTYGKVKRAVDMRTGSEFAVKIVKKSFLKRQRHFDEQRGAFSNALEDVLREVAIMKKLSHPNIVQLHEIIDDPRQDKMYLVLQYVRGGPVLKHAPAAARGAAGGAPPPPPPSPLPEPEVRRCLVDVLLGLEYLHFHSIIHRDVKPENILHDDEHGVYLICDFGVSRLSAEGEEGGSDLAVGSPGTPAYAPPEVLRRDAQAYSGRAADVWSLGVTVYELLLGELPFEADSLDELSMRVCSEQPSFGAGAGAPPRVSPAAVDLLSRMLEKDPERRITLPEIKGHVWVTQDGQQPVAAGLDDTAALERSGAIEISAAEVTQALVELDRSVHLIDTESSRLASHKAPTHRPAELSSDLRKHKSLVLDAALW